MVEPNHPATEVTVLMLVLMNIENNLSLFFISSNNNNNYYYNYN